MKMPWDYPDVLSGPLSSLSAAARGIPPFSHTIASTTHHGTSEGSFGDLSQARMCMHRKEGSGSDCSFGEW